ncbi:MAG: helix-turn-helix domain-containing protein [Geminicoccaceae bacterium]
MVDGLELLMIYGLGVAAIRQPLVFVHKEDLVVSHLLEPEASDETKPDPAAREKDDAAQRPKYAKSALDDADLDRIVIKVARAMDIDKLFLESDLTLADLAAHTGISANYISQAINEKLNCNFFDFVNKRRIDAAKEKLVERQDISIMDIALEVGFNAKSTFNAAFKRFVGMTPSQFRQTMNCQPVDETLSRRPSL